MSKLVDYPEFKVRRAVRQAARADPSLLPVSRGLSYTRDDDIARLELTVAGRLTFNSGWVLGSPAPEVQKLAALKLFTRDRDLHGNKLTGE